MAVQAPLLITRAYVGTGPGMVLISLGAPTGELGKGAVELSEIARLAMTHDTFREITAMFVRTLQEIEAQPPKAPISGGTKKFTLVRT